MHYVIAFIEKIWDGPRILRTATHSRPTPLYFEPNTWVHILHRVNVDTQRSLCL